MGAKRQINNVLLDVDGTLVLSNDAHANSWVEAFAKFGYEVKFEDARRLIGMGGDKLIPKLVTSLNSESGTGKAIADLRTQLLLNKYAAILKPAPGSRQFILKLLEHKLRLMVASSAQSNELSILLKSANVEDLLKAATTSSDAEQSKPDPDIVHAALQKLGVPAEQTVMVGDTPYDIEAATRAGVQIIAVRCGGWGDYELRGAEAIYDGPKDIVNNFQDSIFV